MNSYRWHSPLASNYTHTHTSNKEFQCCRVQRAESPLNGLGVWLASGHLCSFEETASWCHFSVKSGGTDGRKAKVIWPRISCKTNTNNQNATEKKPQITTGRNTLLTLQSNIQALRIGALVAAWSSIVCWKYDYMNNHIRCSHAQPMQDHTLLALWESPCTKP